MWSSWVQVSKLPRYAGINVVSVDKSNLSLGLTECVLSGYETSAFEQFSGLTGMQRSERQGQESVTH